MGWRGQLAIAAAVALALRLIHLWLLVRADPLLIEPVVDAAAYHQWAVDILADPVGDTVFFQSPLYPYFVAAWYGIFGASWVGVAAVQAVLGASSAVLAALVVRQIAPQRPGAALVAAWLMALYQPLIYYDALLLKVELTNVFVLLVLWAMLRGTRRDSRAVTWVGTAGVLLGLLGLLRGNFYLAMPLMAVWAACGPKDLGRKARATRAVVFLCGFSLVMIVVAVRNKVVADQLVFSSAGSGAVLYIGNNPHSPLGDYDHLPFVRTNPKYEEIDFRREAERRTGRDLSTAEASAYWRSEAIAYSLDNPGITARRILHKLGLVAESFELGDNYSPRFHAEFSPLGSPWFPWWTLVLSLSLAWLVFARRDWRAAGPVLIIAATYLASLLIFFVRSRYRIPLVPCFVVLAALELSILAEGHARWRAGEHPGWRLPGRGLVIVAVATVSLTIGVPRAAGENLGPWWARLGTQHVDNADTARGIELMKKGWQLSPDDAILNMNLGRVHLGTDQPNQARFFCDRSLTLDNTRDDARECLAVALLSLGKPEAAQKALAPALRNRMPLERYLLAAAVAEANHNIPRAIQWLDDARRIHGDSPEILAQSLRLAKP